MQEEQPLKPANILNIVAINQGKRKETATTPVSKPLAPSELKGLMSAGHVVVDTRSTAEFGAGHIPGAYNVHLSSPEFEQRVGWMVPDNSPIILVAASEADAQHAIFQMAFIGMDQFVVGHLAGGIEAWMKAGETLRTVAQMDVHTLSRRLASNGLQVLDVRDDEEYEEGHIPDSHFMPYRHLVPQLTLPAQLPNLALDPAKSIAVTCATGKRSSTAISILLQNGFHKLYNITGGMEAWKDAGLPTVKTNGHE